MFQVGGNQRVKEIASLEAVIYGLTERLGDIREATQENAQRKQARSAAEREEELEGGDGAGDEDNDSDGGAGGVDDDDDGEFWKSIQPYISKLAFRLRN